MEMLLALLQNEVDTTRVLLLKLLDIYLKQPPLATRFKRANGFQLLGEILRSYTVSEEILAVLFGILLGKPTSYNILKYGLAPYKSHVRSLSLFILPIRLDLTGLHIVGWLRNVGPPRSALFDSNSRQ